MLMIQNCPGNSCLLHGRENNINMRKKSSVVNLFHKKIVVVIL